MKVLLVNPPFGGVYHKLGFIFPPLGLAYLAAVLRQEGISPRIVDLAVEPDGLSVLDRESFDLVGISGDTCRHPTTRQIVREVRKYGIKTVYGGPHATYMDREILTEEAEFDFVIRREGEYTLRDLCLHWEEPSSYESIAGLSFKTEQGAFLRNEDRPFIRDLDSLPFPARDLLDMDRYRTLELRRRKITPVVTSRGCPFNCPFCCSSEFAGTTWRTHSVERVMAEIEEVTREYKFGAIAFTDDTFTINRDRLRSITRAIIDRGIDIRWWCFTRPDITLDRDGLLEDMAASGARYVFMGMESGNREILSTVKQGINPDKSVIAIATLLKHGIETMASYMFGSVEETIDTAHMTIEFARQLPTGAAQFSIMTPFPGTALWQQLSDKIFDRDWAHYDCTHLVFEHPHLTAKQLRALHDRAYRRYYLTPKRIVTGLLSAVRGRGVRLSKILPVLRQTNR